MAQEQEWHPDPASRIYVYMQIAERIADQIRAGSLPVGARLASEPDLAAQYGVGINTVRRAIRELRERGVADTVPAKGTFIIEVPEPAAGSPEAHRDR
ncbi:winged helix-turn-helix domain-containing protein [Streptomyces sp. ME02-8801-2C]|uniref:winged helix-turn-helix domain-containing protein n=1 Tax=Streptomyces sp. ME02-8801-2C TaxID=3028680 RepID=UPI0029A982B1|nr:winged helix-turn-helix domain-containing protein [Streptomyces sp. ME02-8801-2C]MDX3455712.1 winged helix-turn-helix domain-containing protein [Streptomyces sp. ME02-8801-2C]